MSQIDQQAYSEAIARLQGWLQFLERKAAEYQAQMNRVKRGPQPASEQAFPPVPGDGEIPAPETGEKKEDPWL